MEYIKKNISDNKIKGESAFDGQDLSVKRAF